MKKITRIKKLNEFVAAEPAVKPAEPAVKPAEPAVKPTRPPAPRVNPAPKNKSFLSLLSAMMAKYERLKAMNEAEDPETGLDQGLNQKLKAETSNDTQAALSKQLEVSEIAKKIDELESQYDTALLEEACEEIVREIFGRNDPRFNAEDIKFELTINRGKPGGSELSGMKSNKKLGANPAAVQKRRLANFITQGFAFGAFEKLFDKDINKALDFIDVEVMKLYFRYFEKMNAANAAVDIKDIKAIVEMLEKLPAVQAKAIVAGGGAGGANQGNVKVSYDGDSPTIVAEAGNMITLFHETVKGVFELVSHWGLAHYNSEELKKIYAETEGWIEEYRAFKYGGNVVKAFVEFLKSVAEEVDGKDIDFVAFPATLAWLYNSANLPDEEFVSFMGAVISGKVGDHERAIGVRAYKAAHGIESKEPEDTASAAQDLTMDQLLDKISRSGLQSLTPEEKARLNQLSAENGLGESAVADPRAVAVAALSYLADAWMDEGFEEDDVKHYALYVTTGKPMEDFTVNKEYGGVDVAEFDSETIERMEGLANEKQLKVFKDMAVASGVPGDLLAKEVFSGPGELTLDELLDKISKKGVESLTKQEKSRLDKLSDSIGEGAMIALRDSRRGYVAAMLENTVPRYAAYRITKMVLESDDYTFEFDRKTVDPKRAYDLMRETNVTFVMNPKKGDPDTIEVTAFNTTDVAKLKSAIKM